MRERVCVFFQTLHLRLFKDFGREEEEGKKMTAFGFWVGVGPNDERRHCRRRSLSSLRCFLESWWLLLCLFFFDSFLWPCTRMDSLSHPLFINLPIAIICGFWIPNLSSSIYTYIYLL